MDNPGETQDNSEIIYIEDTDEKDKNLSRTKSLEVINLITFRPDDILFDTSK